MSDSELEHKTYFNRDLSWLAFNERVLEQACSKQYPLLERLRFLAYFSSNLDEFFEIRVAGFIQQVDSGVLDPSFDGLGPKDLLDKIRTKCQALVAKQYECWSQDINQELKKNKFYIKSKEELTETELLWLKDYFINEVQPVLTPLAIDIAHPFPQLLNKGLNIYTWLENPESPEDESITAIIPVPRILPRIIQIRTGEAPYTSYIFLSDLLRDFAGDLFPGYRVRGSWEFRITRNSDLYIDEEEVENLLQKIEEELYSMRRGAAVRLEIREGIPEPQLNKLLRSINLDEDFVFKINGPLNLLRLFSLYDLIESSDLKFPKFTPHIPEPLPYAKNIFEVIKAHEVFLHHPYDSFNPVVDFIQKAADDESVFAIKQTLYRTSGDSQIIEALKDASRKGKQVTALIELKARFDEAQNIAWARQLEEEGVHVVYGIVGLKTHCKCTLVVRRESKGLKKYTHISTGNYNSKTAKHYTDFALLSAEDAITSEIAALFNTLTGLARSPKFEMLQVAPFNLHAKLQSLIKKATESAKAGKAAHIVAKINSLADQTTIDNLYKASCAGVKIDLIVRGICCLTPGIAGLSENICVRSILGQYLEHSRFYYFKEEGKEPVLYIGSSDWMPRNFFKRIEVSFPITDPGIKSYFIETILNTYLDDTFCFHELMPDGSYKARGTGSNHSIQGHFQEVAKKYKLHGKSKQKGEN